MKAVIKEVEKLLNGDPVKQEERNYVEMAKSGLGNFCVGYPPKAVFKHEQLPTFVLDPNKSLRFKPPPKPKQSSQANSEKLNSSICDHIVEAEICQQTIKLIENKDQELSQIQNQLTDIVETGRVNVQTFSHNSIAALTTYDVYGEPVQIKDILMDSENKKYQDLEGSDAAIYDKVPHPIRQKRKKKQKDTDFNVKTERQVLEEFKILSGLFDSESLLKKKGENLSEIIDAVSFTDGNSYQQLWENLVSQMKISREQVKPKKKLINNEMLDNDFDQALDRIINEAIEYEKETFELESEEDDEQEQQQEMEEMQQEKKVVKQEQKKPQTSFEGIKIQKSVKVSHDSRYQFAVEDQSELSDFYDRLPKQKFATPYPFELDDFQKRSILHLQNKESVFVAAHTSAGKTVVAEYGIALAINHKRKVVYTSPIKALSNQKYRELKQKFGSVGIVTGDVSLNQEANCVIMTTEILRNNLYKGAEMIRDIQWVIFDEVHYINNQERGVVWEQTIIMLPEHIGIIMLSATVPNYMDFANWVGRTKRRTIYVMKTLHRPVPLEHSLFIFNKFHVIKEPNGRFLKEEYRELRDHIDDLRTGADTKKKQMKEKKREKIEQRGFYNDPRREQKIKLLNKNAVDKFIKKITRTDLQTSQGREEHRLLQELIDDCKKKKLLPCVIFTFSKKKINQMASKVYSNDLTSRAQKSKIARMFGHALSKLKPQDRYIEQFQFLQQICYNGYAVHHGDLLPLAKQIVELLFSQGLIKVLFATETFAMGINMPTKTVIFNSIKKVTGANGILRFLNSSQYVQMSGRAGRRGLDQKGTVIIIVKDPGNLPEAIEMEKMIDYPGERLESKFRVTYTIILNLVNAKDFGVTEMLRQSFLQNPKFSEFTSNLKSLKNYKSEYERIIDEFQCPYNKLGTRILIDQYMNISKKLRSENKDFFGSYRKVLTQPRYAKIIGLNNQLGTGLVLKVDIEKKNQGTEKYVQVMIINELFLGIQVTKEAIQQEEKKLGIKKKIILQYDEDRKRNERYQSGEVLGTNNRFHYYVYWVSPEIIVEVYSNKLRTKYSFDDSKESYQELSLELLNLPKQLIPSQGIGNASDQDVLLKELETFDCHKCELKDRHQHEYNRRQQLKDKLSHCAKKIDTNELRMMGSFEGMLRLLVKFKFIHNVKEEDGNQYNSLTLKGKVAKEVDIYVAQIILEAVLDELEPSEIAALMSAFVCDYKPRPSKNDDSDERSPFAKDHVYTTKLSKAIDQTYMIVKNIIEEEEASQAYLGLTADSMDEHLLTLLNFHLCETVYKWAIGFDFSEAMSDTKAPEGMIVRTILRLNQLLSNVKSVCRIIGNFDLESKVNIAIQLIKRDIVFCQSLYLTG